MRSEAYRRLRVHGDFVNALQKFFPPPVGHATHFGIHIYGRPKEISFAHLSWLTDAAELPKSFAFAESGELPDGWDQESGVPGVRYKGEWDSRPHPARVVYVSVDTLALWQRLLSMNDSPINQVKLLSPVSTEEQAAIAALANYPVRLGDSTPFFRQDFMRVTRRKKELSDMIFRILVNGAR